MYFGLVTPIKCVTVVPPVVALPLSPSINSHVKQIDIDDSENLRINLFDQPIVSIK